MPDGCDYRHAGQECVTLTWVIEARFLLGVVSQEDEHPFIRLEGHVAALSAHPPFFFFLVSPHIETVASHFKGCGGAL